MGFGGFFLTVIPIWGSIHSGWFTQAPINHALPATSALAERFNNALGEISKQQEMCGSIFFGSVLRDSPSGYGRKI
jgi:hypothetical protein